jgi:membrane-bound lytic murein transglycosylase B
MTKRTTVLAALGVAGTAGALGIALAGPALADPSPAPSASGSAAAPAPSASGSATAPVAPDPRADRGQRQEELAAALATELGIDRDKVAAALAKVQAARQAQRETNAPQKADPAQRLEALKTRLDAAVKEGKLTAEESAAILKAAEAGVLPGGGPHGGPGRGGPGS